MLTQKYYQVESSNSQYGDKKNKINERYCDYKRFTQFKTINGPCIELHYTQSEKKNS